MDFPAGMENPYGYYEEQQGGYYEECYSPNHGGSFYNPDCSDYSYYAQDYYIFLKYVQVWRINPALIGRKC